MESNVLQKRWVQGGNVVVDDLRGTMFTGENGAHTFQISGVDSAQETVEITGTITGRFLTATNVTVPLTGTVSGGVASLTLTEDCYVIPGRFVLSIYATNGSTTQCIYCAVGNVFRTQSDIIEYPSASIPDIEQIIADAQAAATQINAEVTDAQAAVAAAQTAVDGIEAQRQTMIESIASVAGQGTDTTLSQSGVAADAKAAGDQITDLKSALPQWVDNLDNGKRIFEYVWGNIPSSGVVDYGYTPRVRIVTADYAKFAVATVLTVESGYGCIFALYDNTYTKTSRVIYNGPAEITCPANTYYRICIFHASEVPSEIADFADKVWYQSAINKQTTALSGGGYLLNTISSLDNVASNVMDVDQAYGVYRYAVSATSAPSASSGAVMVYRAGATYASEIAMPVTGGVYFRYCDNGTWSNWVNTDAEIKSLSNGGYPLTTVESLDSIGNDVMTADRVYGIYRYAASATSAPSVSSGAVHVFRAGADYQAQIAMPVTGGIYTRYRNGGVWSTWIDMSAKHVYHVEKDGSGDFTSLVDAINTATQFMDSVVYVGAGTWDICAELGDTYLNNVSGDQRGPVLKNRIHLIFASKSTVSCEYTGSRADTMYWLSPFNAGQYGFTLENANIVCSNCRYCVHDERDTDTDAYVNKYINCRMYLDNSSNTNIRTCNPIGGGLGKNGYIEIDGCWFDAEPTQVYVSNLPLVTYHNSAGADAQSHISVKNCYLAGDGRFRFNWYGQSQLITQVDVSGCSMGSSILSQAEVEGSSPYENINITEWNNAIRA